jgi:hypothetical protein
MCCVTASQTNRSGLNAEVITMESISEAFNKCFVADFIFSLSRTPKTNNQTRVVSLLPRTETAQMDLFIMHLLIGQH